MWNGARLFSEDEGLVSAFFKPQASDYRAANRLRSYQIRRLSCRPACLLGIAVPVNRRLDGFVVFGRGFALTGAWIVRKKPFELFDLTLLHLADGVARDLAPILVLASAHLFLYVKAQFRSQIDIERLCFHRQGT